MLKVKLLNKVEYEIQEECKSISSKKKPSVLSHVSPASIISLKDMDVVNELKERAPVTHRCMQAIACSKKRSIKKDGVDYKLVNSLSMAASVLLRCRNPCLSAAAYRLSVLLWHGGAAKKVCINVCFIFNQWENFSITAGGGGEACFA